MPFSEFSGIFKVFFFIPIIGFILVFAIIFIVLIKGLGQWNKNNRSPKLTVEAKIIAKRTDISRHHRRNSHMHYHSTTWHYATFEVESGDRMELQIPRNEFGLLIEGDVGELTFQGTRYLSFERK